MALIEPFEPGSTLKPFIAGRMVETERARMDEVIETYNGIYKTPCRTLTDVHKAERLSLADVIKFSSNIGIARFSERLSRRELYETLRDFGFGAPTGVSYPSEASGVLREPKLWSCSSQASMAIGYEVSVTAVQLAAAYGAIANDGLLLVPTLVKSIRDADGEVVYEHQPQVVRRVLKPKTARMLRDVLASVVDSGTATDASLATFDLGGKSGTARRVSGGGYKEQQLHGDIRSAVSSAGSAIRGSGETRQSTGRLLRRQDGGAGGEGGAAGRDFRARRVARSR
jgi:cell division protein FtsI (penicillin-binding protein 3)